MPFVTFIIPTLARDSLTRTLASLVAQQDPDWSAMVVFDGRPVNTPLLLQDARISWCEKPPPQPGAEASQNAGAARNFGMGQAAAADCEWVGFVDDDDTLHPSYVERLKAHALQDPSVDCVVFRMIGCEHTPLPLPPPEAHFFGLGQVGISFAYKRRLFDAMGIRFADDCAVGEDYALLATMLRKGATLLLSPYLTYYIRQPVPATALGAADCQACASRAVVLYGAKPFLSGGAHPVT
jgi:glycosyltransferase involved in cell wall biosynthesis